MILISKPDSDVDVYMFLFCFRNQKHTCWWFQVCFNWLRRREESVHRYRHRPGSVRDLKAVLRIFPCLLDRCRIGWFVHCDPCNWCWPRFEPTAWWTRPIISHQGRGRRSRVRVPWIGVRFCWRGLLGRCLWGWFPRDRRNWIEKQVLAFNSVDELGEDFIGVDLIHWRINIIDSGTNG